MKHNVLKPVSVRYPVKLDFFDEYGNESEYCVHIIMGVLINFR